MSHHHRRGSPQVSHPHAVLWQALQPTMQHITKTTLHKYRNIYHLIQPYIVIIII